MDFVAYGDEEGFIAYCDAMGYPIATSPTDDITAALLRGSVYIDGRYRSQFSGKKAGGRSQVREWPRMDATDADDEEIDYTEIPNEVIMATYEAAFRELETPNSLIPDVINSQRVTSERVGPLAVSYASSTVIDASDSWPVIGTIDNIMAPLIGSAAPSKLFGESERV